MFFTEQNGKRSWMRAVGAVGTLLPIITWATVSVIQMEMQPVAPVIGIVSVFIGGKIAQKPFEKGGTQ